MRMLTDCTLSKRDSLKWKIFYFKFSQVTKRLFFVTKILHKSQVHAEYSFYDSHSIYTVSFILFSSVLKSIPKIYIYDQYYIWIIWFHTSFKSRSYLFNCKLRTTVLVIILPLEGLRRHYKVQNSILKLREIKQNTV